MATIYSKRYQNLIYIARFCAGVCGADVVDENYAVNYRTFCAVGFGFLYIILTIYTIYIKLSAENDYSILLVTWAMAPSCAQARYYPITFHYKNSKYYLIVVTGLNKVHYSFRASRKS